MMDWFPIVFIVFKVIVLGTGMFFAIKWHHDQERQKNEANAQSELVEHPLDTSNQPADIK